MGNAAKEFKAYMSLTAQQLSTLVDLKQKQNNMIDARTARLQAEQSHLMTLEAEKQGRTLMVFTIVTIVFVSLPQKYPLRHKYGRWSSQYMDYHLHWAHCSCLSLSLLHSLLSPPKSLTTIA